MSAKSLPAFQRVMHFSRKKMCGLLERENRQPASSAWQAPGSAHVAAAPYFDRQFTRYDCYIGERGFWSPSILQPHEKFLRSRSL